MTATERKVPNKLFFKIGEVCEITDTQPYVLRYWESRSEEHTSELQSR